MAIKDLAVAYNGSKNADAAVDLALQMCEKYGACLTGLYASNPVRFEGNIERWISDDLMETLRSAESEVTKSIEEKFRGHIGSTALPEKADFLTEEGQANVVLARQARYYDILLMGQFSAPTDSRLPIRAEDLVMRTGRPLLIVPHSYTVKPFKEYAVVGWDGSRPAARALSDAMQILETKTRLDVVTVGSRQGGGGGRVKSVIRNLKRHGVDARHVDLAASREGVGATLLDYCGENTPDIMVMGAYGHTKLREDLFGGVTRHVLEHMNVPVMMSH